MPLITTLIEHIGLDSARCDSGHSSGLLSKHVPDNSNTSQVRVVLSKPQKVDMISVITVMSQFGEVQSVDLSTHQVDSTVSVSYFDCRAASKVRLGLVNTPIAGISLGESAIHVPFCSTLTARSTLVVADANCEDFLYSVFDRFGEIERIDFDKEYSVIFYDVRSPLTVRRSLLSGESTLIDWAEQLVVSSEQLITLLLMNTDVSPKSATPQSATSRQSSEFLINLRDIDSRTTVMIRNIPKSFSQSILVELLVRKLPPGTFDFVYLPMDLMNGVNVGYAFVNLKESNSVIRVFNLLNNKTWRAIITHCSSVVPESTELHKACKVSYGRIQGLDNLMEHFKSSSIMNQPDSIRPYFATSSRQSLGNQ